LSKRFSNLISQLLFVAADVHDVSQLVKMFCFLSLYVMTNSF